MKKLLFLLIPAAMSAQKLNVTAGINLLGGLSYNMEHEVFGGNVGLNYLPKSDKTIQSVGVSFNYYNDFFPEKTGNENDFYVIKAHASKLFMEWWTITGYVGYANTWENNMMRAFTGAYRTNFSWGAGVQTYDDMITGEIMFESIAGYPHIMAGAKFNLVNLFKKNTK